MRLFTTSLQDIDELQNNAWIMQICQARPLYIMTC